MAKNRLVKNSKGQYGIYNPYTDEVTPITSDMSLVKNTRGKYGFKSGNEVFELDQVPNSINIEETFKKKVATASSSATSSTDSTSDFYKEAGKQEVAPELEQDPKKQLAAKDKAKQEENQRYIDVFGLGRLDYSGLQQFGSLGEVAADVLDVPANLSKAFVRGVSNGRINQAIVDYAKEGGDLDSDMIARLVKENATKTGSVYLDSLQKKGILQTEDMSAVGGIAEVILESLGSMAGAYKAGFQGAVVGGSAAMATGAAAGAIGGPVGSVIGGAVTTTGGAIAGFTGMTSYANEYGASIIQALTKKGYDLTDAKQVEAALKDKSVMNDAKEIANQRGLIIGGIDAMTAGIAGKSARIAVSIAKRSAAQAGKELTKVGVKRLAGGVALGIEAAGGSIGEAAAQLNAEGKITDLDAVALEGIAEIGNAGPTGLYAAYKAGQINSDLNQSNLTKIEELKKAKEALPDDNQATKKALDNKISALEKENKERNKSMTSALQVAPVPATKRVLELTDAITDIESTLEAIKDGTRTDISQEARKAMYDSLNDMIAERDEIRQEMLKASENEAAVNMAPEKPMKPVIFIGENKEKVDNNNATVMSPNKPLEVKKVEEPITFSEKISDEKNAKPGIAYNVAQGNNVFGTIVESDNNGEKQFIVAETGKKYASLDDAKFALQEKLTGQRVSEKERTGVDRVKVEGNLANQKILIGDPANNNELNLEAKSAIQRAVRAMRSVSNANVYLYSNTAEYEKGIAHASKGDEKAVTKGTNAQVVDANGENSIHINLEMADGTTISHEVFHGALLGLAKKDPNAFVAMRDKILDRISEKQNLSVTDATGNKRKVSAKEYLLDFQKRYEGPQYTEADRAEEFLSELAGLMSLEDSTVVKDKSLVDSIKLTIKDVLKKFNVEFESLNELQETEDLVQFFKDFNRSVKTGESINLGKVEGIAGATQPTAQAAPAAQTTPAAQPAKTTPKGTLTKFSILGRDNRFNPANANPGEKNVHYGVDEEGDVFMIAPESKLPTMLYDQRAYIGGLYNITVPNGMRMDEAKGVSITELPKVDSQGNLIKKGRLTYTDTQTIKYDIKQEASAVAATTQPATQVIPTATQPAAKFKETKSVGQESELAPLLTIKREENFKLSDEVIYGKTKIDKNGNTTTGFYTKFGKDEIPVTGASINYDNENNKFYQDTKGSTGRNGEGGRLLSNFEEDYGISFEDVLNGLGIKLKDNEEVLKFRVDKESIEMNDKSGPLNKVYGIAYIVKKGTNGIQSTRKEISFSVPKLKYTDAISGISTTQPAAQAQPAIKPAKYRVTKSGAKIFEPVTVLKVKIEKDGKLADQSVVAKTKIDNKGKVTTDFETKRVSKYYEDRRYTRNGIFYNSEQSFKENEGPTGRNGEGFKSIDDFKSDYGISLEDLVKKHGIKIKDNEYIHHFALQVEQIQNHLKSGEPLYYIKGHLGIRKIGSKENFKDLSADGIQIGTYVPKLKYTDAITGISTAQPEAGAVKESTTTRPEGTQKKESVAKVISRATKEAKQSVKVKAEPAPGKKTVGNKKPISERVKKIDGVLGQASMIEPTSPRDMALQYFINGGRVLRGKSANGARPEPHTLASLFSKPRAGYVYVSKKEMDQRLGLVSGQGLTITQIAEKLWESKENETLQFSDTDFRDAVESVLLEHISRAGMAKELVETKGSPSQRALISGDTTFAGMDDYEIMTHQYAADQLGISVEELLANPDKYIKPEALDGMYDDMLSAFEILDKIQDEEAIKQYLEISKPEDLFLDELVAEAVKPEKTLEEKKAELVAKQKSIKKELAAAKKAKDALVNTGQTSLIEGTQTSIYPPNTLQAVEKVKDLSGKLQDVNDKLAKVESAIEFKGRKTIDAFADVVEQKAEEAKPAGAPLAEIPANEQNNLLKDKEGNPHTFFVIGKTMDRGAFELSTLSVFDRSTINDELGFGTATVSLKNPKKLNYASILFGDIDTDKLASLINEAKKSGSDGIIAIDGNGNIKTAYVFDKSNIHEADIQVSETDKQESGISEDDSVEYMQKKLYEATRDLENAKNEKAEAQIQKNIETIERAIEAKKLSNMVRIGDDMFSNEQIRIADSKQTNEQLEARQEAIQEEYDAIEEEYQIADSVLSRIDPKNKVPFQSASIEAAKLASQKFALVNEAENIAAALRLREYRTKTEPVKAEPAPAETSKVDKEIKSLQDEIEQYEREIEDATEEIENTKYNYKEDVAALREKKAEIRAQKMPRDEKQDALEEIDAEIEEAADERDTYIEQYKEDIANAKREIKSLQKQIDKLSVKTKAQISGERVAVGKEKVSGKSVWNHIVSITPDEEDVPFGLKKDVVDRKFYIEEKYDLASLLDTDPAFKDYYESTIKDGSFRYDPEEVDPNDLYNTIVVVDGELRDGWSRATNLLYQGEKTAEAYVALPKVTAKAQISGERVAPFLKADPTYKYQMSGTEASLKLIDDIRSKYKMQHTAEEMGIVKKGVRATERIISNNVVTRALGRVSAVTYKGFANERANKFLGKPLAVAQKFLTENVMKGLQSQNAVAANASAITVGLIQNLGSTEGFQAARNKLVGGKSVAQNQLWQLGKDLNEMINNDKLALRRVHSLLDPEAFEGITDPTLPDTKADLSFAELRLFNTLRDMNDYIHEWHYQNGFLGTGEAAEALYQKNKGSYFARMYNEIENEKFEDLYDALAKLPNAADFSMFKERKDFADVTESLTLKEDPIYITTKRFGQMMQNQAILQFCDYVAKSGEYKIYKNKEDIPSGAVSNYRLLSPKKGGGKVYGELTGKFVPDIVAQQLVGIEFSNQAVNLMYGAAKVFDKSFIRQVLSKAKTTWNPLTRAGNITMNFVFASLAGVDPITLLKNRPAAKESLESYDSYARDLDANGLLGVSMGKELNNEKDAKAQAALREKLGLKPKTQEVQQEEAPKSKLAILSEATKRMIKDTDQMLTDSYGKADDVAKLALYKSLVDDYGKSREEAIKIVAGSMQNYNTVGKAYDFASKSVNRFVKFKADSSRILFNTFKDRPLNLMATLGMYLAAQALASKMSGEDEEERKIREERPYTNKIKIGPVTISLTMKFGDTEINVARYLAPYSMYDAGYNNNTLKEITTMLPLQYDENTFIAVNDPLIGPIINLINDKDFRGMPISDPGKTPFINKTVTDEEARWNRLAFAARNYGAPYYGWYENIMAAATGDKDYYGRSRTLSDALLNTVIKVQKVDNESLQRTYEGALRKLDRDVDNAAKTISYRRNEINKAIDNKYAEGNSTQEQIDKFIEKEDKRFLDFQAEQLDFIEKQRIEMERVIGVRNRLIEIQQRKQQ